MASLSHLLKVPSLDSTLGAVLLGVIIGSMLYGLTLHQTYRYFKLCSGDVLTLKVLVATIAFLETLHTVVWMIVIYHYAVTDAFDVIDILLSHWSVQLTFLITGLAVFVCQCFYVRRVFLVGPQYRWIVIPAVGSMLAGLSFALVAGVKAFILASSIVDLQQISWLVSTAYGFAVVTDVILTGALIFVLQRLRITGLRRAQSVIDTLIVYTVKTGLLTSVTSIFAFVFALVIPGNLIYAAVSIVSAKLYANSVLALLNSRRSVDNKFFDDFTSIDIPSSVSDAHAKPSKRGKVSECESMTFASFTTVDA